MNPCFGGGDAAIIVVKLAQAPELCHDSVQKCIVISKLVLAPAESCRNKYNEALKKKTKLVLAPEHYRK